MWFGGTPTLDDLLTKALPIVAAIFIAWITNMGVTGWLASRKNRDSGLWVLLALFTGPFALIAILLARKADPKAIEMMVSRIRLKNDAMLEFDVAQRLALLPGEVGPRVDGRPSFRLAPSTDWRWYDGSPMTDEDREKLAVEIPKVGTHEGWTVTLHRDAPGGGATQSA